MEQVVDMLARNGVSFIYKATNTPKFANPTLEEMIDAANRLNAGSLSPESDKPKTGLELAMEFVEKKVKSYEYEITVTEIYRVVVHEKMSIDEKIDIEDGWKFPGKAQPEIKFVERRVEEVQ